MKDFELLKIWMSITEIANKAKHELIDKYGGIEGVFEYINSSLSTNDKFIEKLKYSYNNEKLLYIREKMYRNNIKLVTVSDIIYPNNMKTIDDRPYGVFYKGNIHTLNQNIGLSIVGSRKCTRYGIDVTSMIVEQLSSYNINIISGLAKGIDGIAHSCAVKNGMYTVGILGCGIDVIYPKENKILYEDILDKNGCILSEFPLETKPLSRNFPMRNRIISGISDVVLIIEGGEKSGTLITANTALEQGRDVIVVPGSIFSSESKGTNKLIRDGAIVYTDIDDLLDLLKIESNKRINNRHNSENSCISKELRELYKLIDENPIHINDIIRITNIDINRLYKLLFELQVKENIICLSGNFYVRVNRGF